MIYYIASNAYSQSVMEVIRELGELKAGGGTEKEFSILEFMKKDIVTLGSIKKLLIDLNALRDLDDEIIEALEMFRMMYSEPRIIILAPGHSPGDIILTRCFQMGIYDIIATPDFNLVKEELRLCLEKGKTYKDSVNFKDAKSEKVVIKNELKQTIYKELIGVTGVQRHIGTTHACILLANYLRKQGFRIAVCEITSPERVEGTDFEELREYYEEPLQEGCFTLYSNDYYPSITVEELHKIDKSYNFIILDLGEYESCDMVMFNRCMIKMIVTGSKAYEIPKLNTVFDELSFESLKEVNFLFNFTSKGMQPAIKGDMGEFQDKVFFLPYVDEVFDHSNFPGGEVIFSRYLPSVVDEEKKRFAFWSRRTKTG